MRPGSALLGAGLAAILLAGCDTGGGGSGDEIGQAVETTVLREVAGSLRGDSFGPQTFTESGVGELSLADVKVAQAGDGSARRMTARVRAQIRIRPLPDKADFVRMLPPQGVSGTVTRGVSAMLIEQEGGGWQVVEDSLEVDSPQIEEAPPTADQERARQRTIKAVSALLTWKDDLDGYNRAQGAFYATKLASEADFNQPGFDPAPALVLESKKQGGSGFGLGEVEVGTAWERTNDAGEDDLPLVSVLADNEIDCERFVLRTLTPKTVSGTPEGELEPGQPGVDAGNDELSQTVTISGQALVRAGDWQNKSEYSNCGDKRTGGSGRTVTQGPRELTVNYVARLERLLVEGQGDWFITGLKLASGPTSLDSFSAVGREVSPYTTSGQAD